MYILPLVLILLQCNCNLLELHRRHGIKEYKWQLAILVLYKSLPEKYYLRFYNRFCMNFAYLIHIHLVYRLKNVVAKYFKNLHAQSQVESVANKKRYQHFRYRPAFAPVAILKILVLGQILL